MLAARTAKYLQRRGRRGTWLYQQAVASPGRCTGKIGDDRVAEKRKQHVGGVGGGPPAGELLHVSLADCAIIQ